jgi:hypothetical protein
MQKELITHSFKDIFQQFYNNDVSLAAKDAGVSLQQIRNWNSQNRDFYKLADGRFLLKTVRITIFSPKIDLAITGYGEVNNFLILDFIEKIFFDSRIAAASAAGISLFQLNNMICQHPDKEVVKTETGHFFALHSKCVILNMEHISNVVV